MMKILKIVVVSCVFLFLFTTISSFGICEVAESEKIETEINFILCTSKGPIPNNALEVGSLLEINGTLTPSPSQDVKITLIYTPLTQYGEPLSYNVSTSSGLDGSCTFSHTFCPTVIGQWLITASWDGDDEYKRAESSVRIKVTQQTWIVMTFFIALGIVFISLSLYIAFPYSRRRFKFRPKNGDNILTCIRHHPRTFLDSF